MDNLVNETNSRLTDIINNLTKIKEEYEEKLKANNKEIDAQLDKVQKYKTEFFESKAKIEKMNADIEGFETDYQKLVERFKDDELANILIAANKEISLKIDERKRKIVKDKNAMNELVDKAENVKSKLVKLTAEKKALELCLNRILDAYNYYSKVLGDIIDYSSTHKDNLTGNMPPISIDEEFISNLDTNMESPIDEEINNVEEDIDESEESDNQVSESESQEENENDSQDKDNEDSETEKEEYLEDEEEDIDIDIDIDEDVKPVNRERSIEIVQESDINFMDDVEDEDTGILEPIDISDMVKDEEVSDYDNDEIVEGDEHKIVIENNEVESFIQDDDKEDKKNKKDKKKKDKDEKEEDINIDINFDDSLEDDDSLYE